MVPRAFEFSMPVRGNISQGHSLAEAGSPGLVRNAGVCVHACVRGCVHVFHFLVPVQVLLAVAAKTGLGGSLGRAVAC